MNKGKAAGRKSPVRARRKSAVVTTLKPRGGARAGSGRPQGSGRYGEETKPVRIPLSMYADVMKYIEHKGFSLPMFAMRVPMGAPQPASDEVQETFNMNELIRHPAATYFHPVQGNSMQPTVAAGDLAMIDTAIEPKHGDVVLAWIDGDLTLKRLMKEPNRIWLKADNPKYEPIILDPEQESMICGVMLIAIRPVSTNHVRKF